jgi:hypothetical protein
MMVLTGGVGKVTPSLICDLQHHVSPGKSVWTKKDCQRVCMALLSTKRLRKSLAIMILESQMDEEAEAVVSATVHDVGLMQVRCRLGDDGLCENEPVKGKELEELFSPVENILVAAVLMDSKEKAFGKDWLSKYGGCRKPTCSYPRKVAAMEVALSGKMPRLRSHDRRKSLYAKVAKVVKNHHFDHAK